jgi:hypothetical protein
MIIQMNATVCAAVNHGEDYGTRSLAVIRAKSRQGSKDGALTSRNENSGKPGGGAVLSGNDGQRCCGHHHLRIAEDVCRGRTILPAGLAVYSPPTVFLRVQGEVSAGGPIRPSCKIAGICGPTRACRGRGGLRSSSSAAGK